MQKTTLRTAILMGSLLAAAHSAVHAQAPAVSINFQGDTVNLDGSSYSNFINSTETAGTDALTNWTNDTGGNSGSINKTFGSNTGTTPSGTTATFNSYQAGTSGFELVDTSAPTPDYKLMNGYIESGPSSAAQNATVTISTIPYASYNLYVYLFNGTVETGTYTITDKPNTLIPLASQTATTLSSFTGTFVDATSTGGGNYLLFTGLTDPNIVLTATPTSATSNDQFIPIDGFQIAAAPAAAPEPAGFVPVLMGAALLGGLAAKRRRAAKVCA